MSDSYWIELWLLNELECEGRQVSRLINPNHDDTANYWEFPAHAALHAPAQAKLDCLKRCTARGWIDLYPASWLSDKVFRARPDAANVAANDNTSINDTWAFLTLQGHHEWEREFQPDWSRFWRLQGDTRDELTGLRTITVLYASNEILDELCQYLPSLLSLSHGTDLTEVSCHTHFQYQATLWKTLLLAKVVTWEGRDNDDEWNTLVSGAQSGPQLSREVGKLRDDHELAFKTLCRLSRKWTCVRASAGNRRDAEPAELGAPDPTANKESEATS